MERGHVVYVFFTDDGKVEDFPIRFIPNIVRGDICEWVRRKYTLTLKSWDDKPGYDKIPIAEGAFWNNPLLARNIVDATIEYDKKYDWNLYPATPAMSMACATRGILPQKFTQESADAFITYSVENILKVPLEYTRYSQWLELVTYSRFEPSTYKIPDIFLTQEICDIINERFETLMKPAKPAPKVVVKY